MKWSRAAEIKQVLPTLRSNDRRSIDSGADGDVEPQASRPDRSPAFGRVVHDDARGSGRRRDRRPCVGGVPDGLRTNRTWGGGPAPGNLEKTAYAPTGWDRGEVGGFLPERPSEPGRGQGRPEHLPEAHKVRFLQARVQLRLRRVDLLQVARRRHDSVLDVVRDARRLRGRAGGRRISGRSLVSAQGRRSRSAP